MSPIGLIFPHQLFEHHPVLSTTKRLVLVEHPHFFTRYGFHKQKLLLHRASMKAFFEKLKNKGKEVAYLDIASLNGKGDVFSSFKAVTEVHVADLDDLYLERDIATQAAALDAEVITHASPGFVSTLDETVGVLQRKPGYLMASFYQEQRKRLGYLVQNGKPLGGKWSFDQENRKRLPADIVVPPLPRFRRSKHLDEAKSYVEKHFPDNPGSLSEFRYPITHSQAKRALEDFIAKRFARYGAYQDAIISEQTFLFHSVLSPAINTGLLTPDTVVEEAVNRADHYGVPLNSLEGFVRQVIGWREYVRGVYALAGTKQRTENFWNHSRKIPGSFWRGETGVEPIDCVIRRVLETGYCHHIERLMIVGNFMLLCEFDPDEVYRWFMELFIDSYDWVMVPNVYGMSQYSDGGLIVTKPYISSSNYVRKMSDFKTGGWCEIWDGLFWRFVAKHREFFESNPRMKVMVMQLDRMSVEKRDRHIQVANSYLDGL